MEKQLYQNKENIKQIILDLQQKIKIAPKGALVIEKRGAYIRYFHRLEKSSSKGTYISKSNIHLAKQLAQKGYHQKLLSCALDLQKKIDKNIFFLIDQELAKVYDDMSDFRKDLITPLFISDEEYIKDWETKPYQKLGFSPDDKTEYYTDKNERVRSKTEILIANMMNSLGIPYRYEQTIYFSNGQWKVPDFTLLLMPSRREVYLEHCGKMNDEGYLNDFFDKINIYNKNNIFVGVNLFMTFEDNEHQINVPNLRKYLISIQELG